MKVQLEILGGFLLGVGLRWISFDYELNERLEFSSGLTSYSQLLEELEYPTPAPLHARNDLLHGLIRLGVVSRLFFIFVDVLLALIIYFSLEHDLSTSRKLRFEHETELLLLWEKEGRPRLYSEGEEVLINLVDDDDKNEPLAYAACARFSMDDSFSSLPTTLALVYFLCPVSILTCGSQSFAPLFSLLNLSAVFWAQKQQPVLAAWFFVLAIGAQGFIMGFILFVPLLLLLLQTSNRRLFGLAVVGAMVVVVYFFPSSGRLPFTTPFLDLRPNVGLWWYLETEVFAQYQAYFTLLLEAFLYLSQTCLHLFLSSRALVLAHFSLAVYATFQPFPEMFHVFLAVLLLGFHSEFLLHEEWLWPCLIVLTTVVLVLQPLMLYLWLERGSGNANYYYFQNLASNGMVAILLVRFYAKVNTRDAVLRRISKFFKSNKKD